MPVRRLARLFLLLSLGCLAHAPSARAQGALPGEITVSGVVLDALSGAPVADAVIELPRLKRKFGTDGRGRFVLRGIRSGPLTWSVSRLGYAAWEQEVEPTEDGAEFTVRILPRPEVLEGITVVADRFEARRRPVAMSVQAVERDRILASAAATALDVVAGGTWIRPMACDAGDLDTNCAVVRGQLVRPRVFVDDVRMPGGLEVLRSYIPQELYLVEAYAGGSYVRVYTNDYVERLAKTRRPLPPLFPW